MKMLERHQRGRRLAGEREIVRELESEYVPIFNRAEVPPLVEEAKEEIE
jgi:hypothetical protein